MQEKTAALWQKKKETMLAFQELLLEEEKLLSSEDEAAVLSALDSLMTAKEKVLQELGSLQETHAAFYRESADSPAARELQELAASIRRQGQSNIAGWKEKNSLLQGKIMKLRQGRKLLRGYEPAYVLPTYFIDKKR